MLKPGKTLYNILLPTLVILSMILATPTYSQNSQTSVIRIQIGGGSGNCYFKEGDKEYGWTWCPTTPIIGNYVSCECINIDGATYPLYKLLKDVVAVIKIKYTSNMIFDGRNKVIDGNSHSSNGIDITYSSNVTIGNTTARESLGAGVRVDYGSNCVIRFSTFEHNSIGISIGGSTGGIQVFSNNVKNNSIGVMCKLS